MKARIIFSGPYRECKPLVEALEEHASNVSEQELWDTWRYDIFYDDYDIAYQMLQMMNWENGMIGDIEVSLEKW